MLGRGVAAEIRSGRDPESFWGDALGVLREADLVVANLECAITEHPERWTRTPKVFHFAAPPEAVDVLAAAGIRLVSLANNHVLDHEVEGLLETIRRLDEAGIAHAGAGRDAASAARPAVAEAAGTGVGMVAFTDNEPGWEAGPGRPGTSWARFLPTTDVLDRVERGVDEARERGADLVVLSLHWGPNMVERPPLKFQRFAERAIPRGIGLVHGHSAHIFQGIGVLDGVPIAYDAGDALDDYAVDPVLRNDRSLLFLADVEDGAVRRLSLVPIRLGSAVVNRARGDDFDWIADRVIALSAEIGTRIEREGDRLVVDLEGAAPSAR